ncbi:MAG: DUF1003 domain-containing protein [Bacteroidota bacterium]
MQNSKNQMSCSVNGKVYLPHELKPNFSVASPMAAFIKKQGYELNPDGYISHEAYNAMKKLQLQELLAKENGELNALQKDVLASFDDQDLMTTDVDENFDTSLTFGQKISDKIAAFGGSWKFIIIFFAIILLWMFVNAILLSKQAFDSYPFILLNLVLSCLAAIQAPIIMMSQNRQEERDRLRSKNDYKINLKAELEIRMLHEKIDFILNHQGQHLHELQRQQLEIMEEFAKLNERRAQ